MDQQRVPTAGNEMTEIDQLSEKAQLYCEWYCVHFNKKKAAEAAGLTQAPSHDDPRIQQLINAKRKVLSDKVDVSASWVIERLRQFASVSAADYFEMRETIPGGPKQMRLKSLDDLTEDQRSALKSLSFTMAGPKIEVYDGMAAIAHIGKALGIFKDELVLSGTGQDGAIESTITHTMTPREAADAYKDMIGGK
jgi:hypothetical protein